MRIQLSNLRMSIQKSMAEIALDQDGFDQTFSHKKLIKFCSNKILIVLSSVHIFFKD